MKEISYVMVKPEFANDENVVNYVKDRLVGIEGTTILDEGYVKYDAERAARHYANKLAEPYYPQIEEYMTSDKAYGMVIEGKDVIAKIREVVGPTKINDETIANNPCVVNTIRYIVPEKLGVERRVTQNVVHASDAVDTALNEIAIFKELKAEYSKQNETEKTK